MALSSWLCSHSTRSMVVKIVHPGGRVELHDRPILAAEIMEQNPRSCVTHPHVFREPAGAVVSPDTVLLLGQKFYVVPLSTLRKLRRASMKHQSGSPQNDDDVTSPTMASVHQNISSHADGEGRWMGGAFFLFFRKTNSSTTPKGSYRSLKNMDGESDASTQTKDEVKEETLSDDGCVKCVLTTGTKQEQGEKLILTDDDVMLSSTDESTRISKEVAREKAKGRFPRRRRSKKSLPATPLHYWQPNLESITEE